MHRPPSPAASDAPSQLCGLTAAAQAVRECWPTRPRVGIVLGSGLGDFIEAMQVEVRLSYVSIPGFPISTALGHAGEFVCGTVDGNPVAVMRGRCHLYEGYSLEQVTFGVRVLGELGSESLLLSCAAGGLNPHFAAGDLMLIRDHLDLLKTRNRDTSEGAGVPRSLVPAVPQAVRPTTDPRINRRLAEIALATRIRLREGTYIAVTGPNYETRAELRFLRSIADAVGMSTVPEIAAAAAMKLPVAAIALITNLCRPDAPQQTRGDDVLRAASSAEPEFRALLRAYLSADSAGFPPRQYPHD